MTIALWGKLAGVIWMDFSLTILLYGSLLAILFGALSLTQGWADVISQSSAAGKFTVRTESPQTVGDGRGSGWGAFFAVSIGMTMNSLSQYVANQNSAQHFLASGSLTSARNTIWLQLPFTLFAVGLLYAIGLVVFAAKCGLYSGTVATPRPCVDASTKPDQVLIRFVVDHLNWYGVPVFFVSGIIAATLTTSCSGFVAIQTVASTDLFPRAKLSPQAWIFLIAVASVASALIAEMLPSLLYASNAVISVSSGPLLATFVSSYLSTTTESGVRQALLVGFLLSILLPIVQITAPHSYLGGVSFMWFPLASFLTSLCVGLMLS
jgi:hypothetical protein